MKEKQEQQALEASERAEPQSDLFDRDRVLEALAAYRAAVREDAARPAERTAELTEDKQLAQFD